VCVSILTKMKPCVNNVVIVSVHANRKRSQSAQKMMTSTKSTYSLPPAPIHPQKSTSSQSLRHKPAPPPVPPPLVRHKLSLRHSASVTARRWLFATTCRTGFNRSEEVGVPVHLQTRGMQKHMSADCADDYHELVWK
jgi:hypothetical protein